MRMRSYLLISIFILLFLCQSAYSSVKQKFKFESFFDYYGGFEQSEGYQNLRSRLFVYPRYTATDSDAGIELTASAKFWVQGFADQTIIDPWDVLYENYYIKKYSAFDIVVGQKLVSYGFADVYGPLNVLHSTNRELLSLDDSFDTRRPDPLVQFRIYPSYKDTIEFTYVPVTRPDKERRDDVYLTKTDDTVKWSNDPYILDAPHSLFLNYSHFGDDFDFQILYGWYTEQTPDFVITDFDTTRATDINVEYNKKHTVGGAYATSIGSSSFSQDIALGFTDDFSGKKIGNQDSDITVNSQILVYLPWDILSQYSVVYAYFFNHDQYDKGDDHQAAEYLAEEIHDFHNQPYQHILFFVGHFEKSFLREKLKARMNVGFFFSPDVYISPRVTYSITDYCSWETGIDYTFGDPPDIKLRRNPSNDNFYTRIMMRY